MHNSKHFTLTIPYNDEQDEPSYGDMQELLQRMVETYAEFGHVNHDESHEDEDAVQYMVKHKVKVYDCRASRQYEDWDNSIKNASRCRTREEAEARLPVLYSMVYDYERSMGCPIDGVKQTIIEDSNERFPYKVVNRPKYYTF